MIKKRPLISLVGSGLAGTVLSSAKFLGENQDDYWRRGRERGGGEITKLITIQII